MDSLWALAVDYLWYHAITLATVVLISFLFVVHHVGSEKNRKIAAETQAVLHPFLKESFKDYSGEIVVESGNILKVYASGRESCFFAIFAYAVQMRLIRQSPDSKSSPSCSTRCSSG